MASRPALVKSLYRRILRQARVFPSVKRDSLVEDIRIEFREGAMLVDEAEVRTVAWKESKKPDLPPRSDSAHIFLGRLVVASCSCFVVGE
jgi:hypothetical protein